MYFGFIGQLSSHSISYSLTIASPLVSMALAVDMTFLTFAIVALTVGALKIGDFFQNTRNALACEAPVGMSYT